MSTNYQRSAGGTGFFWRLPIRAATFPALHFGRSIKEPLKPRRHPPGLLPRVRRGGEEAEVEVERERIYY